MILIPEWLYWILAGATVVSFCEWVLRGIIAVCKWHEKLESERKED